ncbi:MAG: hypothetical protein JNM00_04910 [Flavobacteriales bacterium]|nr:hypothetical protein [Flavobacteriales bacterium]
MKNKFQFLTKKINAKLLAMVSLLLIVQSSCNYHNDEDFHSQAKIPGIVREKYTGNPIPYAYVDVVADEYVDLWNSILTVVDTIQADENGKFEIDRQKLRNYRDDYNVTSYFACADGPNINGIDAYIPNCSEGGTFVDENSSDYITCEVYAVGWVRFFIEDVGEPNPEITNVSIHDLWSGGPSFGFPFGYDPEVGYMASMRGNKELEIDYTLNKWADGIQDNDIDYSITVFVTGLDTTDVQIDY